MTACKRRLFLVWEKFSPDAVLVPLVTHMGAGMNQAHVVLVKPVNICTCVSLCILHAWLCTYAIVYRLLWLLLSVLWHRWVGRATGRASSLWKAVFWFVDGVSLTGALHVL